MKSDAGFSYSVVLLTAGGQRFLQSPGELMLVIPEAMQKEERRKMTKEVKRLQLERARCGL